MRGKTRFYRVRLIAYDGIPISRWRFPPRIPSPSPTPMTFLPHRLPNRTRHPHKIHLIRIKSIKGTTPFVS